MLFRSIPRDETLAGLRARAAHDIERLPDGLRRLDKADHYPVAVSEALRALVTALDHDIRTR